MAEVEAFKRSWEASRIIERLKQAHKGDLVTYKELEQLVGRPIEGATPCLRTAIHRMEVDEERIFKPDRSHGVVWLDDVGIVKDMGERTRAVKRYATRTYDRGSKISNFAALSPENQRKHSTMMGISAVLSHLTQPKQLKAIEETVRPGQRELPISDTLKMFTKKPEEE